MRYIAIFLLILLGGYFGWTQTLPYYKRPRLPDFATKGGLLLACALVLYLVLPALAPNTARLTQTIKDHPQKTNIEIDFSKISGAIVDQLMRSPESIALANRIRAIQAQPVAEEQPAAPADTSNASGGSVIPADCGKPVKSEVDGFSAYQCGQLHILIPTDMYQGQHAEFVAQTAKAYQSDVDRSGLRFSGEEKISYDLEGQCRHGYTEQSKRLVHAYVCSSETIGHAVLIMAHEMGHQLEADNFEHDKDRPLWLGEGFASWISAPYWFGGAAPRDFVRSNYPGMRFPIESGGSADDLSYNQWAAMVDFIIQNPQWGKDKFYELYNSGPNIEYQQILGVSFDQLQDQYYSWLGV